MSNGNDELRLVQIVAECHAGSSAEISKTAVNRAKQKACDKTDINDGF